MIGGLESTRVYFVCVGSKPWIESNWFRIPHPEQVDRSMRSMGSNVRETPVLLPPPRRRSTLATAAAAGGMLLQLLLPLLAALLALPCSQAFALAASTAPAPASASASARPGRLWMTARGDGGDGASGSSSGSGPAFEEFSAFIQEQQKAIIAAIEVGRWVVWSVVWGVGWRGRSRGVRSTRFNRPNT